jgi:hypothetical protein
MIHITEAEARIKALEKEVFGATHEERQAKKQADAKAAAKREPKREPEREPPL